MSQTGAKTRHSDADEASNVIEERLRLLIDTIPTIVWRKLPDGTVDFLNQQFREYTGLSLEDGLGWLHQPMLDEAGLEDALRHYVKGFAERTGIEVELEISPRLGRMKPGVELALFRVVQESLTNIQRHSGSFQAKIRIERDPRKITLEISDKGSGIPGNLRRQNGELSFGPWGRHPEHARASKAHWRPA